MRSISKYFENKKIDYDKLLKYGFIKNNDAYIFERKIEDYFKIIIKISNEEKTSKIIDLENNSEYILADIESVSGSFVNKIKRQYEDLLNDIVKCCTNFNIFKSDSSKKIIKYVKEKYNDDLEYLWEKFPNNAIWRNKTNNKWYGLLMTISERKLGIDSDKIIEVINLRYQKLNIEKMIDNKSIFKGHHMNKNNWITIKLDGKVNINQIFKLIDNSYEISLNKK